MTLLTKIGPDKVALKLLKNRRIIDIEETKYYHDLTEVLISILDKILKRNKIDTTALNLFKIQEKTGKNSTSYKIVAAFIEGLKTKS